MTFSEERIKEIIAASHNEDECVCHYPNNTEAEWLMVAARKIKEEYYMELLLATTCEHTQCKNAFRSASEECMNKHPYDVTITGKDLRILLNSLSHVKTERRVPGEMVDHTVAAMPAAAAKEHSLSQPSDKTNPRMDPAASTVGNHSLADAGELSVDAESQNKRESLKEDVLRDSADVKHAARKGLGKKCGMGLHKSCVSKQRCGCSCHKKEERK